MKPIIPCSLFLLVSLPLCAGSVSDVHIQGFSFRPPTIIVEQFDTVRWTNLDAIGHSVTSQIGPGTLIPSGLFDSGKIFLGEEFQFTFVETGTFYYYCQPHGSSMQGTVIVVERPRGDVNCDGGIDNFDIDPFVVALVDPVGYDNQYPDCDASLADVNRDGRVDNFDVDPFVDALTAE